MRRRASFILTVIAFAFAGVNMCAVFAAPPAGYYAAAEGRTGAALKTALHSIIRRHTALPYSAPSGTLDSSDALAVLDQAPGDSSAVRLVYSGLSVAKSNFGNAAGWDREHLWPNSYGIDDVMPAYSDLHNLRACDATVNSSRGNLPYDESDPAAAGFREPGHVEAVGTSRDGDSWEPRETEKGDIARAMFYMAVRYAGNAGNEPDLELTDEMATVTSSGFRMGRLTTLIEWSLIDPPDAAETARNDAVFGYQGNRNPFIDRPEWILAVFGNPLTLAMQPAPGGFALSWPSLRRGVLEVSPDLTGWQNAPWIPVAVPAGFSVSVPTSASKQFLRLSLK